MICLPCVRLLCGSDRCISKFLFQDLPNLADVPAQDKDQLFIRKLRLCSYIFEFEPEPKPDAAGNVPPAQPDPWAAEKEIKRQALLELVDHLNKSKPVLSEPILHELIEMVSVNLFRPLPPASAEVGIYDPDEDDPVRSETIRNNQKQSDYQIISFNHFQLLKQLQGFSFLSFVKIK